MNQARSVVGNPLALREEVEPFGGDTRQPVFAPTLSDLFTAAQARLDEEARALPRRSVQRVTETEESVRPRYGFD
jgi:hypothetical protein